MNEATFVISYAAKGFFAGIGFLIAVLFVAAIALIIFKITHWIIGKLI